MEHSIYEKLIFVQLVKKSPCFYGTEVYFLVPRSLPLSSVIFFTKPDDLFTTACIRYAELQFAEVAAIQEAVTDELTKAQKEEFSAGFQKLYDRAKTSIYANEAYFE